MRSDKAANYIPPHKRKQLKEYLAYDSVKKQLGSDKSNSEVAENFRTSSQTMMKAPSSMQSPEDLKRQLNNVIDS